MRCASRRSRGHSPGRPLPDPAVQAATIRSLVSLEPLWRDLADALPHIVLRADEDDDDMNLDPGFRLHRRVIEISDGLLELRPYRSKTVLETARRRVYAHTTLGAGFVEAALTRAALAALRSGRKPCDAVVAELTPRGGDLRAEADWLVTVAHAYADGAALDAAPADERPDVVGV
ncbi:MAB_1171c family putative transporter [Streptomyces sp. NPDC004031]